MTTTGSKYHRQIMQTLPEPIETQNKVITVDVYEVLRAFAVTDPGLQHAIKKLLCVGIRGHKTAADDLLEAIDAITRTLQLYLSNRTKHDDLENKKRLAGGDSVPGETAKSNHVGDAPPTGRSTHQK